MGETKLKEHTLPLNSFMGGWYISPEICDELINHYEMNKKYSEKGTCGFDGTKKILDLNNKVSFDLPVGEHNYDNCVGIYRNMLQEVLNNYLNKYSWANKVCPFDIFTSYNIQKYPKGGGFKTWHMENTGSPVSKKRHLVFMTYLNDVEDGGTEFFYQNITTPAKKGLTLIWPAGWTHTHRGQVNNKKEKYIVTGWYNFLGENDD